MRLLLDTHAFLWWFSGSEHLSLSARRAIADDGNTILVSAASVWEVAAKYRLGQIPEAEALALDIAWAMASQDFEELPITADDALRAGSLPGPHLDPFDKALIAQALSRNLLLVSGEALFDQYGVRRLW